MEIDDELDDTPIARKSVEANRAVIEGTELNLG